MARAKMVEKEIKNRLGKRKVGRITGYEPCVERKSISDPKTFATALVSEGQRINWHKREKRTLQVNK